MITLKQTRNHFGPDFTDEELEAIHDFCVKLAEKEVEMFWKYYMKNVPLKLQSNRHANTTDSQECN
ncbi:MAG: hypothetical protein Q8M15_07465 [Bacteroidota bacterium]|nr:hypothetical protein [Bacteroidota bacterium]